MRDLKHAFALALGLALVLTLVASEAAAGPFGRRGGGCSGGCCSGCGGGSCGGTFAPGTCGAGGCGSAGRGWAYPGAAAYTGYQWVRCPSGTQLALYYDGFQVGVYKPSCGCYARYDHVKGTFGPWGSTCPCPPPAPPAACDCPCGCAKCPCTAGQCGSGTCPTCR